MGFDLGFVGDAGSWIGENLNPSAIKDGLTSPFKRESAHGQVDPQGRLGSQSNQAGGFADVGEKGFRQLGNESAHVRQDLRNLASGKNSISAEQLRQSLQQNQAAHMSMAAGAAPQNQAMAARTAMTGMGRAATGMAGQQAMAGIAERQAAQQALANMLMQQRQQELQAALGGRGQAIQGFGAIEGARTSRYGADMGTPTSAESMLGTAGSLIK